MGGVLREVSEVSPTAILPPEAEPVGDSGQEDGAERDAGIEKSQFSGVKIRALLDSFCGLECDGLNGAVLMAVCLRKGLQAPRRKAACRDRTRNMQ